MTKHATTLNLHGVERSRGSVLVSGASSGIGLATAVMLAEQGFRVFAGYRQEADGKRLGEQHARIIPTLLDITCQDSVDKAQQFIQGEVNDGGLHGLINNAGLAVGGPLEFLPIEALRHQLEVNVIGQVALTQACIPLLRQAKGRVINMGSIAGLSALPYAGPYSASKFALEALTDALRVELRPWDIEVVIIEPGVIKTPIWDKSLQRAAQMEQAAKPGLNALYGTALEALKRATQKSAQRGISPNHVACVVLDALCAKRPRTRYLVGRAAQLRPLLCALPDRLKDWLIVQKLGLPG